MTTKEKRSFIANLQEQDVPIVGVVAYWNIRSVLITKTEFAILLKECDLPEKFAREHNYRSAFIRALRVMEEERIIRKVSEDKDFIVYQFTAEKLVDVSAKIGELEYKYETRVIVNKNKYFETGNFTQALVDEMPGYKAEPTITKKVIELYEKEKVQYRSSDITRYIQRMLQELADFITLRDQGNVYFIPSAFMDVVKKLTKLVSKLGSSANGNMFEWLPIQDTQESRITLQRSVVEELESIIKQLGEDISKTWGQDTPDKIKETWMQSRLAKVQRIKDRISVYKDIVPEEQKKAFEGTVEGLAQRILKVRKLNLDDM